METGILHTHHLVVVLYVLLIVFYFVVLLSKRRNAWLALKARTRLIRIPLEVLLLGTGVFLMVKSPVGISLYMGVKLGAILLAIALFVMGTKKMNAVYTLFSLLLFLYAYFLSRTRHIALKPEEMQVHEAYLSASDDLSKGKAIYDIACARCHGTKGDAGYRKAKNLITTSLSDDAKAGYIKMGRGVMPSYAYMNEQEIQALLKYLGELQKSSGK